MKKTNQKLYNKNGKLVYEGDCLNGIPNGHGIEYLLNGNKYEGDFKMGIKEGKGKIFDKSGRKIYEGDIKNNQVEGNGIRYFKGGKIVGEFSKDSANGKCTMYDQFDRIEFIGIYKDGKPFQGEKYHFDYKISEGYWKDHKLDGDGIEYHQYSDKKKYEGNYVAGKLHGKGKEFDEKGKLIVEGEYCLGKFVKGDYFIYDYKNRKDDAFDFSLVKIHVDHLVFGDDNIETNTGVHYDKNGKKIFEGRIYRGNYYEGKLFNKYGYMIYDGSFKDNSYWIGKLYTGCENNILEYNGEFFNGKFSGRGALYDTKYGGLIYEGGFNNGEFHGMGTLYGNSYRFEHGIEV